MFCKWVQSRAMASLQESNEVVTYTPTYIDIFDDDNTEEQFYDENLKKKKDWEYCCEFGEEL